MSRKKCVKKDFPITTCKTKVFNRCEGWKGPKERKSKDSSKPKSIKKSVPSEKGNLFSSNLTKGMQTFQKGIDKIEMKHKTKSLTSKIRGHY